MSVRFPNRARSGCAVAIVLVIATGTTRAQNAQPKATQLDPVVVTAARTAQPIADALADVTVIGADEILRSGVQSLAELLQRQPGVEIVQNGGPGSVSGALLRGANRGQTLVLIDGLRVGSSSAGSTTLEAIPLDQIDRIEILRGPASSLYGADAIGGVVQVFTKRPQGPAQGTTFTPNISAGYGTYNTAAVSARILRNERSRCAFRCRRAAAAATASMRSSIRTTSATTPIATGFPQRTCRPTSTGRGPPDRKSRCSISATGSTASSTAARPISTIARSRRCRRGARRAATGSTTRGRRWSRPGKAATIPTRRQASATSRSRRRSANTCGRTISRCPWARWARSSSGAKNTCRPTPISRSRSAIPIPLTGVYQLRYEAFALQANLRRDDSSQYGGQDDGRNSVGIHRVACVALDRRLQHRFQGAVVQRSLLSGFLQSGPGAGNVQEHRGRRVLERVAQAKRGGKRASSASTTR